MDLSKVDKNDLADSTSVGFFEAESEEYHRIAKQKKKLKMVKIANFSMSGVLPEYGSWHYDRKGLILEKHPEVRQLIGTNYWTAVIFFIPLTIQLALSYYVETAPLWVLLLLSYTVGAVLSANMSVIGHEAAHGLVFGNPRWLNKLFACVAFTPCFMGPFANYWSVEHMYHHQVVVDKMNRYGSQQNGFIVKLIVTLLFVHTLTVVFIFTSTLLLIICFFTIALRLIGLRKTFFISKYPLPPYKNFPQVIGKWFLINQLICTSYFVALYYFIGPYAILYHYLCIYWPHSLHPLGMRQVQEHYLRIKEQPTNSVYGFMQFFVLNVGYHTEHHDFPNIPWNRLPKLRALAPEFYDTLFHYNSYTEVLRNFLFDKGIPTSVLMEGSILSN